MKQEQRYELVSTLGRGGMAEVFLGWMYSVGGLRRKVAIKRILPELVQKQGKLFEQMFVDEARLAFQLEHDNIVRVYDVGQTSNSFFIVMEYVEGMDLKRIAEQMIIRNIQFPINVALYIMLQACSGLAYAHNLTDENGKALGLIHNDISPPNILIGRYGEVKIADFGLSDAGSNDVATPEGMVKGKFAYISPEGTRNPPKITSRSDIFSLGTVLWEMLAGQRLFQRDTDLETFKAVRSTIIPDIRQIRDDIPVELLKILHTALAADPEQRYESAEQMYLDLSSFATAYQYSINRYDLCWLIDDLAEKNWRGFAGERVTKDMVQDLEQELGGMLPPGDVDMLKGFVTGMSVAPEDSQLGQQRKDAPGGSSWASDVFDDLGFERGSGVGQRLEAKGQDNHSDRLHVKSGSDLKLKSGASISGVSKPSQSRARHGSVTTPIKTATDSDMKRLMQTEVTNPEIRIHDKLPSSRAKNKFSGPRQLSQRELQVVRRRTLIGGIWGAVGGVVLGIIMGVIIGMYL